MKMSDRPPVYSLYCNEKGQPFPQINPSTGTILEQIADTWGPITVTRPDNLKDMVWHSSSHPVQEYIDDLREIRKRIEALEAWKEQLYNLETKN